MNMLNLLLKSKLCLIIFIGIAGVDNIPPDTTVTAKDTIPHDTICIKQAKQQTENNMFRTDSLHDELKSVDQELKDLIKKIKESNTTFDF